MPRQKPSTNCVEAALYPGYISWSQFRKAIEHGDCELIKRFLLSHHDQAYLSCIANKTLGRGNVTYALEVAAYFGHFDAFNLLYTHAAFQEAKLHFSKAVGTEFKWHLSHLLEIACRCGHVDIVKMLLVDGKTTWIPQIRSVLRKVLLAAICGRNLEIIKTIYDTLMDLDFGKNANIVDLTYEGGVRVDMLYQLGFSADWIVERLNDSKTPTPHQIIYMEKSLDLLPSRWWRFKDMYGRYAIDQACAMGSVEVLHQLMRKLENTDVNLTFRRYALECASRLGHSEVVEYLLDYPWHDSAQLNRNLILESSIRTALPAEHFALTKLVLNRLVDRHRNTRKRNKSKRRWSILRKPRSVQDDDEQIDSLLVNFVGTYGNLDLLQYIVDNIEFTLRVATTIIHRCFANPDLMEFYVANRKNILKRYMGNDEDCVLMEQSSHCVDLVSFELMLPYLLQNEANLLNAIRWLFVYLRSVSEVYWRDDPTGFMYVQKLALLYCICTHYSRLKKLPTYFITFMENQLRRVRYFGYFKYLFDTVDLSHIFLRDLIRNSWPEIIESDHSRQSSRHQIQLLRSMSSWRQPTITSAQLASLVTGSDENDVLNFIDQLRECGIRILTYDNTYHELEPIYRDGNRRGSETGPVHMSPLRLKSLCRITVRRSIRRACPVGNMAAMIATLFTDNWLPRELVRYLLFRD